DAGLWAPDIRYVDGQYRMYYVVTQTTVTAEQNDNAIGMAVAPTPAGPWTDSGGPVVGPRRGASGDPGDFLWTFDPSVVTDSDGSQVMFYGSYYGGVFATRLSNDGTHPLGSPTQVAIDNKFEGAYVVRHGGYWYLFASTANCCAGPTTGYSVQVGRSARLTGPYVDAQGVLLLSSRAGGTPTLMQNGNRWIGSGHNAVATDLAGQDWIVYHAVDRTEPYLNGSDGIPRRPMLIDRLDWVNDWPTVRAGRGPSDDTQAGPAIGGRWATDFASGIGPQWSQLGGWSTAHDAQSGQYAASAGPAALLTASGSGFTAAAPSTGVRVEADLRSPAPAYGLVAGDVRSPLSDGVVVVLDPVSRSLWLQVWRRGDLAGQRRAELPVGLDTATWHALSLTVRDGTATAQLSNARQGDPMTSLSLGVAGLSLSPRGGALAAGRGVGVDNLSVLPAQELVTRRALLPVPGRLDPGASDEFVGNALQPGWSWVRPDINAVVAQGRLTWPTEAADLVGTSNDAGILLRDPGPGDWAVETKVSLDVGVDTVRNFQQAGLLVYVNDDLFTRLSQVAIWDTRQVEFGKEMPYAGRLSYGGTIVGPPSSTTWLRLTHSLSKVTGEHVLRAWSSRDGVTWVEGGVWTLPAQSILRVGLVSMGGAGGTATFDYFRLYRD
ncbi:MAG: family 43 glycosylhydrolase, partial [Lapillicoccus sp.]